MDILSNEESLNKLFGVYLLMSQNVKYKGRVYIGFTVNPQRRILQHNKGKDFGGAKKTSGKGPWEMVLMVHGFPNEIAALRFEWAWQNPKKSRMLKFNNIEKMNYRENDFTYRLRVMNKMLNSGPWYRFPLIVNIIAIEYSATIMSANESIPSHMKIEHGPVSAPQSYVPNLQKCPSSLYNQNELKCYICREYFENGIPIIICNINNCNMTAHIHCLAKFMLESNGHILPTNGNCPNCLQNFHYGELISKHLFIF